MLHPLLQALYKQVTGTPYYTVRTASVEFGPPPAAQFREQLAQYADAQLLHLWGPEFLAKLRQRERAGVAR